MAKHDGKPGLNMNDDGPADGMSPVAGDPTARAMRQLGGAVGMVQTRTTFQTAIAVQVPRKLEAVRDEVVKEAGFCGEDFYYAWTVDAFDKATGTTRKELIEGTSIDGAMIMLRNWGNAICEPEQLDETPTHWLLRATFIDLEKGFTSARLFRQRKSQRAGKMGAERSEDIAFQIGQSKAMRNTVVRCMPAWLVASGMEAAKVAAAKKYANVQEHLVKVAAAFVALGVTEAQLQRKIGKDFRDWVPGDIVLARAIYKAIKDGQTTVANEFSPDAPAEQPSGVDVTAQAQAAEAPTDPATPVAREAAAVAPAEYARTVSMPDTVTPEPIVQTMADNAAAHVAHVAAEALKAAAAAGAPAPAATQAPPQAAPTATATPVGQTATLPLEPPKPKGKRNREPGED